VDRETQFKEAIKIGLAMTIAFTHRLNRINTASMTMLALLTGLILGYRREWVFSCSDSASAH
jgi:xanthine/uracil permease